MTLNEKTNEIYSQQWLNKTGHRSGQRPILLVYGVQALFGTCFAATALAPERQRTLQILYRERTFADSRFNVTVSDCVANTDVHGKPLYPERGSIVN
jgi:hypothetical protein